MVATSTKLHAVPAPVIRRKSMPRLTAAIQTTSPVGVTAVGRRHPRDRIHPIAAPATNGHAVSATPAAVTPSA